MEKLILDSFDFSFSEEDFFRAVRIDPEDDPDFAEEAREVIAEGLKLSRPKAVCVCLDTGTDENRAVIGGRVLENPFIAQKLSQSNICVPYVATCGTEVKLWAEGLSDPIHRWWADEVMLQLLNQTMKHLYSAVKERWFADAEHLTALNPGSLVHWPIEGQKDLFALLSGGAEEIGVELTPSMLMLPAKSCSGIYFSSAKDYENCELCPRIDCPNRLAEFCGSTDWSAK